MAEDRVGRVNFAVINGGRNSGRTLKSITDTLKELEAYKNGSCTNNCPHFDNSIEYVRNKAIDEFADRMIIMMPGHRQDISHIADQMKGDETHEAN